MNSATGFPKPHVIRPATISDLPAALSIRQARELADDGTTYTSTDMLTAEWEGLGQQLGEQVWVAAAEDGRPLGYAQLERSDRVFIPRLWALPDHHEGSVESALLEHAEQQARAIGRVEDAHSARFFAQATSSHPQAQQALQEAGFAVTSPYEKMERALDQPPDTPEAITGIVIRPFDVEREAGMVYRADEEAFQDQRGHTPRTFEQWSQRLNLGGATYDPSLWRIAWDADTVAGVSIGEVVSDVGWIHHLSVRRPWRRRGLGAALMLSTLGELYRLGIRRVRLNVDAQSLTNAHLLYRRLGFRVIGAYTNHEKIVPLNAHATT